MLLGVDDTDAPSGGCTTHVLTELVALARDQGLDVLGEPRLVRLNPNVPWKTRGNAALSVALGHGRGEFRRIGSIHGRPVLAFGRGSSPSGPELAEFRESAWKRVLDLSPPSERSDPALVVARHRLPDRLYVAAVTTVVAPRDVEEALRSVGGAWWRTHGANRGIVGAAAAAAWPGRRRTWELIAYRRPGASGPRDIDAESVRAAARREPALFLCHDPRTRRLMVAPHTPCPILFGLRSRTPEGALRAREWIRSEPVDRWLLFRTNQGTGDHLRGGAADVSLPFTPGRLRGLVTSEPETLRGGHVALSLTVGAGHIVACRVFEPTKVLPGVARALRPGDSVELWGGTGPDPVFRVEGIRLLRHAGPSLRSIAPRCPSCRRRTRSLGTARGFRCPGCRRRWPPEAAARPPRSSPLALGTYHPTPSARRHLAPLGPEPRPE
ncbi:MAG TPA: tRNA(Ile)(2)-agmatinylcytidine synthase [Thermoplasmata archaeon]|jgi:tRNA(Ile2)-agmatinylcytidine synthase|nr:tRNA(Ile)(2)-agmatinylcytidine synthase [Thermoplasmata archaeon]